jgi:hypothetical protein
MRGILPEFNNAASARRMLRRQVLSDVHGSGPSTFRFRVVAWAGERRIATYSTKDGGTGSSGEIYTPPCLALRVERHNPRIQSGPQHRSKYSELLPFNDPDLESQAAAIVDEANRLGLSIASDVSERWPPGGEVNLAHLVTEPLKSGECWEDRLEKLVSAA